MRLAYIRRVNSLQWRADFYTFPGRRRTVEIIQGPMLAVARRVREWQRRPVVHVEIPIEEAPTG